MRGRRRGSLIIGVSILTIPEEQQGLPNGGNGLWQTNRYRSSSCKAAVSLHNCRQPLWDGGGCGKECAREVCRSNEESRAPKAQFKVIAMTGRKEERVKRSY